MLPEKYRKASGVRCARCGMYAHGTGFSTSQYEDGRMKRFIRRWLGLPDPHGACSVQAELVAISVEIGALKGLLIDKGVCSIEEIDAAIERQKQVFGE